MSRLQGALKNSVSTVAGRTWTGLSLFLIPLLALLAVHQFSTLPVRPSAALSGLHASGARLVDGSGRPVILHGADMSGQEFACAQGGTPGNEGWGIFGGQPEDSPSTFAAMQSWHINAVRLPLNEDCWLGINGINPAYGGASYRSAITTLVNDLNAAGFYVIVDLHWNAPGTAVALSQQPMADEDHSPAFWQSVATTFAGNPNVVFDLYNEPFLYGSYLQNPNQDPWACWLNGCGANQYLTGGQPYTKSQAWQTAGMQQLVNVVRQAGAGNLILVNGLDWANDDSGWLSHRPYDPAGNLAAGAHIYNTEGCDTVSCWNSVLAPIAQQYPIIVGETGDHANAGCTLSFLPILLPWADAHGISYLAWTWNPWGYTHDVLITNWNGSPTPCEGQYYQAHLAALAGQPVPSPVPSSSPTSQPPPPSPTPSPSSTPTDPTPTPSIDPGPSPTPSGPPPTLGQLPPGGSVLFSDNFQNDSPGSPPAGWKLSSASAGWTVQAAERGGHVLNHGGWAGYAHVGNTTWSGYSLSVAVKPSGWASENDGLMFGWTDGRHYSLDIVAGNQLVLGRWINGTWTQLASASYGFTSTWYQLRVDFSGGSLEAYVNGRQLLHATDATLSSGAIGFEVNSPVQFTNVTVTRI